MSNDNSFPQGEGTTFGEYSTTTNVNGIQSHFTPSVDAIPGAEAEFGGYQTVTNEIGRDSSFNLAGGDIPQSNNNEEILGDMSTSLNVGGNQFGSSVDILEATSMAGGNALKNENFATTTKIGIESEFTNSDNRIPNSGELTDLNFQTTETAFDANILENTTPIGTGATFGDFQTIIRATIEELDE